MTRLVKGGSTDVSVIVRVVDDTDGTPETGVAYNTAGVDLWYRREGAAKTSITEVTQTASGAHSDGGFVHIGDGYCRLDLPDAAVAAGVSSVAIGGTFTGMVVIGTEIQIVSFDPEDSVRAGLTALPNAAANAAGGLPVSAGGSLALDTFLGRITGNVALASVCTETRLAELDAANLPADVDTLTSRLSAARAGYLDELAAGNIPADLDSLLTRLTAARAGYLDNLNIGENVAGTSEVTAIQNNTRAVRVVPPVLERPDSGTTAFRVEIFLYDENGNMEAPDAAPTIGVVNEGGTSRDANLSATTMVEISTGRYRVTYSVADDHALEQLVFTFSVVEGGATRLYGNGAQVVDTTAVDFTAADRTKLEAIKTVTDLIPDGGALSTIGTDTARLTAARAQVLTDLIDGGRLDNMLDAMALEATVGGLNDLSSADVTAAVLDGTNDIETGFSLRQAVRLIAAACCCVLTGAGTTTNVFKGLDGTTTRITATCDEDGNRSVVVFVKGS